MRIILEVGIGEEGLVHRHGGVPFSQSRASPEAFFFLPHCTAFIIGVPLSWIEPAPSALETQSSKHWIAREVPKMTHF